MRAAVRIAGPILLVLHQDGHWPATRARCLVRVSTWSRMMSAEPASAAVPVTSALSAGRDVRF